MVHILWIAAIVFGVSFVSNVSPFFGASYTLLATLQLTLIGFSPLNFLVIVLVSALGATVAKVAIYFGAFELKSVLVRNKNIRLIGRNSSTRRFYLALFATALLPVLPLDDFIYIGAGATNASIWSMAIVTLLAKILKSGFEIALELTILKDIANAFGFSNLYTTIGLSAVFLVIGILIYKLDWERIYRRVRPSASPGPTGPL